MRRGNRGYLVSEAMEGLFDMIDAGPRMREAQALAFWPSVVGEQAAAATRAESIRDGVMFIRTKSSVWSHELTLHKSYLINKVNSRVGKQVIKDIVYQARGIAETVEEPTADLEPTPEELASVVLPPAEAEKASAEILTLGKIGNEKMRDSIERRILHEFRLRQWRLEHGWRLCESCEAVHHDDGPLCPICRLCR